MKYVKSLLYIVFSCTALSSFCSESTQDKKYEELSRQEAKEEIERRSFKNHISETLMSDAQVPTSEVKESSECRKCIKKYPHLQNISEHDVKTLLITTNLFKQSIETLSKKGGSVADIHQFFKFVNKAFSPEDVERMINEADGDDTHFIKLVGELMADLQECTSLIKSR